MADLPALAPRVLCLGEALVDRLGPLGGDPSTASVADCDDRLGGAPANVACALARLGTPVGLIGRLGEDAIGAAFRDLFRQPGCCCAGASIVMQVAQVEWCWFAAMPMGSACFRALPEIRP